MNQLDEHVKTQQGFGMLCLLYPLLRVNQTSSRKQLNTNFGNYCMDINLKA